MMLDKLFENAVRVRAASCREVWYQSFDPDPRTGYDFDIGRGGPIGLGQPESIFRFRMRRLVEKVEGQITGSAPCALHCDDPDCGCPDPILPVSNA